MGLRSLKQSLGRFLPGHEPPRSSVEDVRINVYFEVGQQDELPKANLEDLRQRRLQDVSNLRDVRSAADAQRKICEHLKTQHGEESAEFMTELRAKAAYDLYLGSYEDSISALEQVLGSNHELDTSIPSKEGDPILEHVGHPKYELAKALARGERYEEAEKLYKKLLSEAAEQGTDGAIAMIQCKTGLAEMLAHFGHDREAIRLAEEALKDADAYYGVKDIIKVATVHESLAKVYLVLQCWDRYLQHTQEIHDTVLEKYGEDSPYVENARYTLAVAWSRTGHEGNAHDVVMKWFAKQSTRPGVPLRWLMARWHKALCTSIDGGKTWGDFEEMQYVLKKVESWETWPSVKFSDPNGRLILRDAFRACQALGECEPLISIVKGALVQGTERLGKNSIVNAQLLLLYTEICIATGNFGNAIDQLKEARGIFEKELEEDALFTQNCKDLLETLQNDQGTLDSDKALALLRCKADEMKRRHGSYSAAAIGANFAVLAALKEFDRADEANGHLHGMMDFPVDDFGAAQFAVRISQIFVQSKHFSEAKDMSMQALPFYEKQFGIDIVDTLRLALNIAGYQGRLDKIELADDMFKKVIERAVRSKGHIHTFREEATRAWRDFQLREGLVTKRKEMSETHFFADLDRKVKKKSKKGKELPKTPISIKFKELEKKHSK